MAMCITFAMIPRLTGCKWSLGEKRKGEDRKGRKKGKRKGLPGGIQTWLASLIVSSGNRRPKIYVKRKKEKDVEGGKRGEKGGRLRGGR